MTTQLEQALSELQGAAQEAPPVVNDPVVPAVAPEAPAAPEVAPTIEAPPAEEYGTPIEYLRQISEAMKSMRNPEPAPVDEPEPEQVQLGVTDEMIMALANKYNVDPAVLAANYELSVMVSGQQVDRVLSNMPSVYSDAAQEYIEQTTPQGQAPLVTRDELSAAIKSRGVSPAQLAASSRQERMAFLQDMEALALANKVRSGGYRAFQAETPPIDPKSPSNVVPRPQSVVQQGDSAEVLEYADALMKQMRVPKDDALKIARDVVKFEQQERGR